MHPVPPPRASDTPHPAGDALSTADERTTSAVAMRARSALRRLTREEVLSAADMAEADARLSRLRDLTAEIEPTEQVRELASAMLDQHDLRGADALQLAAALVLWRERPRGRPFVCYDKKLRAAADAAGFTVLPA